MSRAAGSMNRAAAVSALASWAWGMGHRGCFTAGGQEIISIAHALTCPDMPPIAPASPLSPCVQPTSSA